MYIFIIRNASHGETHFSLSEVKCENENTLSAFGWEIKNLPT